MKEHVTSRRTTGVLIFLITSIALVLRFYRFPHIMEWQDTGVELLQAFHIASFHEYPLLGVSANSIHFFHPPWYTYLLGLIAKLIPNITALLGLSVLFHALATISVYIVALTLFGSSVALLSALLYATNPFIVGFSHALQSQNIIVPVFWTALALWVISLKKKNPWISMIAIVLLVFSSTVNYSAFILLPIVFVWDIYQKRMSRPALVARFTLWSILFVIGYSPLFLYFGIWETIRHLLHIPLTVNQSAREIYHFNILGPVVCIFLAWLMLHLWKRGISGLVRYGTYLVITGIVIYSVARIITLPMKGTYVETLSCAHIVTDALSVNGDLFFKTRVVIKDWQHSNKWDDMTVLFERILDQKLVALSPRRDYFHWIAEDSYVYLLCMKDDYGTPNFLTETCPNEFTRDNASYRLIQQVPSEQSLPCRVYTFERLRN